jgi:RHS repeat-associated protein
VRTYRRCERVLLFHRFAEELGAPEYLVRSTTFTYEDNPIASLLTAARQSGYVRNKDGTYFEKSMPPVEFGYSRVEWTNEVHDLPTTPANLPIGVDGTEYTWVDLEGEGLTGILSRGSSNWFYRSNLGHGQFSPAKALTALPSLAGGRNQLLDLDGNGQLDMVVFDGSGSGFFERTAEGDWASFRSLQSFPNVDWRQPNLRFVDLTGDGRADLLVTEEDVFSWCASLGETGFANWQQTSTAADEDAGPRLVFEDGAESLFLADMSGDGLADLVRIRNADICYWPNLGYGRFGAKVTMANSPVLDTAQEFDQRRIRLADVAGSGLTDLVYLGADSIQIYLNQSGNSWGIAQAITVAPGAHELASAAVVDLMGTGTGYLVWTRLSEAGAASIRYVDLMNGRKPYLLVSSINNLGAETQITYAASSKFYLADQAAGKPWITRLPFPVHVVESIETRDAISQSVFVTRYAYHHGYFDGIDREFRGFGMVEQWDSEQYGALGHGSNLPPILSKTWFHTGIYFDKQEITKSFQVEYWNRSFLGDSMLPAGLTAEEQREACRALRGTMLRQEVYAQDGSEKQANPYTVTEQSFTVRSVQPRGTNEHAVLFSHSRESITAQYDRNPSDPRIAHTFTLEVDDFANVLASASVAYGRQQADLSLSPDDQREQLRTHVAFVEAGFTNAISLESAYRAPAPCETLSYAVTGLAPSSPAEIFTFEQIALAHAEAVRIPYESEPSPGSLQARLVEHTRVVYRSNDLSTLLAVGAIESRAIPGEAYSLAFTDPLVGRLFENQVTDTILAEGGYVRLAGGGWWIPSGRTYLSPNQTDSPSEELAYARLHFFQPCRLVTPFGQQSTVQYDRYNLLPIEVGDSLGNRTTAGERAPLAGEPLVRSGLDYRVLQPVLVMDANRNRTAVAFDALGMVTASAVMGKPEESLGDSLAGLLADVPESTILAHLADPLTDPGALLAGASTRLVYDLHAFYRTRLQPAPQPPVVYTLARETHAPDTRIQHSLSYSDGFGREIQKKHQAAPLADKKPRWVGSGWTIFNNKAKPVRQFEPFFSDTHAFEFAPIHGVSSILLYDSAGRGVATIHPNHTWEKVVFSPWIQQAWDVNDTSLLDPAQDPDVGAFITPLPTSEYLPTWHDQRNSGQLGAPETQAAERTTSHAGTPGTTHLDSLGRNFLMLQQNRFTPIGADAPVDRLLRTRIVFDDEGNQREVIDPLGRTAMRSDFDMLGNALVSISMDAGERRVFTDIAGTPIRQWDSRGHLFRTEFDALRRPLRTFVSGAGTESDPDTRGKEILTGSVEYGENHPDAIALNLRAKPWRTYDSAGETVVSRYDFKGNVLRSERALAAGYRNLVDWNSAPALDSERFVTEGEYDAMNRPVSMVQPDRTIIRPSYDEAGVLTRLEVNLKGESAATLFVHGIEYDAKGQRQRIEYGNGTHTEYSYDPLTYRLIRLLTMRGAEPVQDLSYVYDAAGNITSIRDAAQQPVFFRNAIVEPSSEYTYDALYQLIRATGREHIGQLAQPQPDWKDEFRVNLPHAQDGAAMRRYTEEYDYDDAANILQMVHLASNGNWTRRFAYEASNNRLKSSTVGAWAEVYPHNVHGSFTSMPHLAAMVWNCNERLQRVDLGGGGTVYFVYDASGQRVRKVHEHNGAKVEERIYLGGVEIYRSRLAGQVQLERQTLHLLDGQSRLAMVETRTIGEDGSPAELVRYQLGNHLGSACLELDELGQLISYEEYYPYGSTSYQAVEAGLRAAAKRYRYTSMERDEETGLGHHGARYYAMWLGRWTAADPAGLAGGPNIWCYCGNLPVGLVDSTGRAPEESRATETEWLRLEASAAASKMNALRWSSLASSFDSKSLEVGSVVLSIDGGSYVAVRIGASIEKSEFYLSPGHPEGDPGSLFAGSKQRSSTRESTDLHAALDNFSILSAFLALGGLPNPGDLADAANGALYLYEGDYVNAGISFVGIVSFGEIGVVTRASNRAFKGAGKLAAPLFEPIAESAVKVFKDRGLRAEFSSELLNQVRNARQRSGLFGGVSDYVTNFASMKVLVNGKVEYFTAQNLAESPLHSEGVLAKTLEWLRKNGDRVEVLQVFTERIPCSDCTALIDKMDAFGDADVFFAIGDANKGSLNRADALFKLYNGG